MADETTTQPAAEAAPKAEPAPKASAPAVQASASQGDGGYSQANIDLWTDGMDEDTMKGAMDFAQMTADKGIPFEAAHGLYKTMQEMGEASTKQGEQAYREMQMEAAGVKKPEEWKALEDRFNAVLGNKADSKVGLDDLDPDLVPHVVKLLDRISGSMQMAAPGTDAEAGAGEQTKADPRHSVSYNGKNYSFNPSNIDSVMAFQDKQVEGSDGKKIRLIDLPGAQTKVNRAVADLQRNYRYKPQQVNADGRTSA